jgi:alpha-mannosidase
MLHSTDASGPPDFDRLMEAWNQSVSMEGAGTSEEGFGDLPAIRYSTGLEFLEAATKGNPSLPAITGERPNVWLYIHGPTHHRAISAGRAAARLLPAAETFSTVEALLAGTFKAYPEDALNRAWKKAIYPDHGFGGYKGDITDRLFRVKMESAMKVGWDLLQEAMQSISRRIAFKAGASLPVVVFNALSWKRTGPVEFKVDPDGLEKRPFHLEDGQGTPLPFQQLFSPGNTRAILFVAPDVPPLGYKTFYLVPGKSRADPTERTTLENRYYRIKEGPGGILTILDKDLDKEILRTDTFLGGEVFTLQSVGNGAGEFAEVQQPTLEGFDKLSSHKPEWRLVEKGPVRTTMAFMKALEHCRIFEEVSLYHGCKRIDFNLKILDWDGTMNREFRMAFPLDLKGAEIAYDAPMCVATVGESEIEGAAGERYVQPCSEVHPREVQDWFHASDGKTGVTISSSVAVFDWMDPTAKKAPYPTLQPVLLASRRSCHGRGNWYLQSGDHSYRFSLFSHEGGWRRGYRHGVEGAQPLKAVCPGRGDGKRTLPDAFSFASIDPGRFIVTTLKKCEDDDHVILRFYEIEGLEGTAEIRMSFPFARAAKANLIEDEGEKLSMQDGVIRVPSGHHSIETIKLFRKSQ